MRTFDDIVRAELAAASPGTDYTIDCFVSSEVGYNEVLARCLPAGERGGAYLGVGPDQSYTYVGALRSELAIIVDARLDNLIEHLVFKALFVEAIDPLDYLCLLLGRRRPEVRLETDVPGPRLVERLLARPLDRRAQDDARRAVGRLLERLGAAPPIAAAAERILSEFVRRQLRITSVSEACLVNLDKIPDFEEVICATTPEGLNLHYLTSLARFAHVQRLHRADRIVPLLGNVTEPSTIDRVASIARASGERIDAIYLSNLEEFLLRRYVIEGERIVARPNPSGLLSADEGKAYRALVEGLRALPRDPDAILIRFYFPGEHRGRLMGAFPWLVPHVTFLDTFLSRFDAAPPRSVLETYV